jgi:hypothetical protein
VADYPVIPAALPSDWVGASARPAETATG